MEKRSAVRRKLFQKHWLKLPQFETWLLEVADGNKAYCKACSVEIVAGKSELLHHARTKKHQNQMETFKEQNILSHVKPTIILERLPESEVANRQELNVEAIPQFKDPRRTFGTKVKKTFQEKWLLIPEFSSWLRPGPTSDSAICVCCKAVLQAGKSELSSHSKTRKHIVNLENTSEENFFEPQLPSIDTYEQSKEPTIFSIDLRSDAQSEIDLFRNENDTLFADYLFGTDPKTIGAETKISELLGMEAGLFFPTEALANLTAVFTHCPFRGSHVIMGTESQMFVENNEALKKMGGVVRETITNLSDGSISSPELEELLQTNKPISPMVKLVCVELAHLLSGGRVPSLSSLREVKEMCSSSNFPLHCDGRYFLQACAAYNSPCKSIASGFSSVTISLHKAFNFPMGAILTGSRDFIRRAHLIRQMIGAQTHQLGSVVIDSIDEWLEYYEGEMLKTHRIACYLGRELVSAKSKSLWVDLEQIETNVIHLLTNGGVGKIVVERLNTINKDETDEIKSTVIVMATLVNHNTVRLVVHPKSVRVKFRLVAKKLVFIARELDNVDLKSTELTFLT